METDTILTRFYKKFGSPLPRDHPLLIGSDHPSFGLTFNLPECLRRMFTKAGHVYSLYETEPIKILPRLEYQCRDQEDDNNLICSWSTSRLIAGMSVLDSRPYIRCKVQFSTQEFPIFVTRKVNNLDITVVIAPEEWTVKPDGYPVPHDDSTKAAIKEFYKINITWLTHILGTTWWIVNYYDSGGYSEYSMKCSNCGAEMLPSDFRQDHPQCVCWCQCDECEKFRRYAEYVDTMQWSSRKKWL